MSAQTGVITPGYIRSAGLAAPPNVSGTINVEGYEGITLENRLGGLSLALSQSGPPVLGQSFVIPPWHRGTLPLDPSARDLFWSVAWESVINSGHSAYDILSENSIAATPPRACPYVLTQTSPVAFTCEHIFPPDSRTLIVAPIVTGDPAPKLLHRMPSPIFGVGINMVLLGSQSDADQFSVKQYMSGIWDGTTDVASLLDVIPNDVSYGDNYLRPLFQVIGQWIWISIPGAMALSFSEQRVSNDFGNGYRVALSVGAIL